MKNNVSSVYKYNGKMFRYNFDHNVVEYIYKADKEMIRDNEEWKANHNGRELFEIDANGYCLVDSIGLREENWKCREVRDEYLDEWISEINYECSLMVSEFI